MAARALGELGDPRFERHEGPFGDCLLPPFIEIPGGTYSISSDDGDADERPVDHVTLDGFAIARFPVTNAEWRLFMIAGGYDDPAPVERGAPSLHGNLVRSPQFDKGWRTS